MGFSVPDDLSIVGWDDSLISQVVHPPLTAITRDITGFGVEAARHLLAAIDGDATGDVETAMGELTTRGSTGRPRSIVAGRGQQLLIAEYFGLTLNRISDWLSEFDATRIVL